MSKHYILMGDVTGSRKLEAVDLHNKLQTLLSACNVRLADSILSPYTTTLGDEFQGIATSLPATLDAIFYLEDMRMQIGCNFEIRYVVHYGEIETPINREVAYGMLGAGLTHARELLTEKRRSRSRFQFDLEETALSENLNRIFKAMQGMSKRWSPPNYPLVLEMLSTHNNEEVASKFNKNKSQIWKRRKNLLVEEYKLLRKVALSLAETTHQKVLQ
jgi:hypothetical protein